jgi:hypothetical protein
MAERKVRVMHDGKEVDAFDVPIKESSDKWSEYVLDDGTVIRIKLSLISAARVPGSYDNLGYPAYATVVTPTLVVVDSDPKFRRKDN